MKTVDSNKKSMLGEIQFVNFKPTTKVSHRNN